MLMIGGLLLGVETLTAFGDSSFSEGRSQDGHMDRDGGRRVHSLAASPGAYVEGRLTVVDGLFDLHLVTADGGLGRRLLEEVEGGDTFRFVAQDDDVTLAVTARSDGGGAYRLSLERLVPLDDQEDPPREFLSPTLAALAADMRDGGTTEAFWQTVAAQGTPLIEPLEDSADQAVLTFLVRGAKRNARVIGAPSGDHEWLERLGQTDVWFKSFIVPTATRLAYRIAPDVPRIPGSARDRRRALLATVQADPLNKHPWPVDAPDRFNQWSTVALADAPVQPGLDVPPARHGNLRTVDLAAASLETSRRVHLYTSAGFSASDPDAVLLVMLDGDAYTARVPVPQILDRLIEQGRLPPMAAAFLVNPDNATRGRDLPGSATFAKAVAEDLMALVRQETGLSPTPARTVIAGSSYGGLAAARIAFAYSSVFGNAIPMSPSFWWHPSGTAEDLSEHLAATVAAAPPVQVRYHLSAGTFEYGHGTDVAIRDSARHMRDVLVAKGYEATLCEYAAGHDYLVWRGALADGLIALFGTADESLPGYCRSGLTGLGQSAGRD